MLIEARTIDFLRLTMCTDNVYAEIPEAAPDSFILVTLADRTEKDQISRATIEAYSYATSKAEASAIDRHVREQMPLFTAYNEISRCKLDGGDDVPDMWLEKYRYRSVFNIVYYDD